MSYKTRTSCAIHRPMLKYVKKLMIIKWKEEKPNLKFIFKNERDLLKMTKTLITTQKVPNWK